MITAGSKAIKYKSLDGVTTDIDVSSRTVQVYFSKFGNKDLDGDIILPGAFAKTVAERGPRGKNEIFHLFNHRADLNNVLGKPKELVEDAYGLKATTTLINTKEADAVLEGYNAGIYNQHSIGFSVIKWQRNELAQAMELTELKLYEGSTVLWGANPETPFLGFTKGLQDIDDTRIEQYVNDMWANYEELYRLEKKGVLSADYIGLAHLQRSKLKSLHRELAQLVAVEKGQSLDSTDLTDPLKDFKVADFLKNTFHTQNILQWT
jgi:uncharacterized protein